MAPGVSAAPGERDPDPNPKAPIAGSGRTPSTEPAVHDTVVVEVPPSPVNVKDSAVIDRFVGMRSGLAAPIAFAIAGTAGDRKPLVRGGDLFDFLGYLQFGPAWNSRDKSQCTGKVGRCPIICP